MTHYETMVCSVMYQIGIHEQLLKVGPTFSLWTSQFCSDNHLSQLKMVKTTSSMLEIIRNLILFYIVVCMKFN